MSDSHFDTLIIGAGISGIGAAHHLRERCPQDRIAILEARDAIGGTWDLFRYPGIRSDSDMITMGYPFRPWTRPEAISPGKAIREYVEETARAEGIDSVIRFGHRVVGAHWSSLDNRWTLDVRVGGPGSETRATYTCSFLFACSGYYRYAAGYQPAFPGQAQFQGPIVHPQHWDESLELAGKRVVVIGSGATAVTLLPALAERGAMVTMLQRSPTYVVSMPAVDRTVQALHRWFPAPVAHWLARAKNTLFMALSYQLVTRFPERAKKQILAQVRAQVGPGVDVERHFQPSYNPWEQRMCLVPDADLFRALRAGKAAVVTDTIAHVDATGIVLTSGERLDADIIVSATGLEMQLLGGMAISVDGAPVDFAKTLAYKGVMFSGVPNLASVFGYINASWTLKADLVASYVARLRATMRRRDIARVVPRTNADDHIGGEFVEGFSAGYMQRAIAHWPKQGTRKPWRVNQNYFRDLFDLRFAKLDDGVLRFEGARETHRPIAPATTAIPHASS